MEIVIENPSSDGASTTTTNIPSPNPGFASHPPHNRSYRAAYVASDAISPSVEYYATLGPARPRSRLISPEPDFETQQIPTSVRRVDRSGLLEIADLEPQRSSSRSRNLIGAENSNHSGTLTRRIDRSGLLEAVPELPDQCAGWKTPEKTMSASLSERKLTGAELVEKKDDSRQESLTPRIATETLEAQEIDQRSRISPTTNLTSSSMMTSSCSSPYLRRYPGGSPNSNLERPTPVLVTSSSGNSSSRNSFTCVSPSTTKFLPIDALPPRARQSYVDLTGATYTRSSSTSPLTISSSNLTESGGDSKKPDFIGRSSPRSRSERQSTLTTMSAIPDVIEAHGSRVSQQQQQQRCSEKDNKDRGPEGERAEAEGCEHTAIESLEETRVSFKASNKILHNDNIQTLRVIILSEQL